MAHLEKKLFINSFRILSSVLFPLITIPYVSRVIQPSGFGKVDFANSIIAIFLMFSNLGIPTYGIRLVAQHKHDKRELSECVKQLLYLQLIGVFICYLVFFVCLFLNGKMYNEKWLFLILSISIIMNGIGVDWFFSGLEEYSYITVRNGIFQIISLVLILLLVKKPSDYLIYAFITVISSFGTNVLNLLYLRKKVDLSCKITHKYLHHIKGMMVFFVLILLGTSLTKLESIMIGFLLDYNEVGIYAAANKIIQSTLNIFLGIGMTFLPTLIGYMATDKTQFNNMLEKSVDLVYLVTVPTCVGLFILAPQIIPLVLGSKFLLSILPFKILVPVIFITTLNVVVANQIFMSSHKEAYAAYPIIVTCVLAPITNYLLIPKYGVAGASMALLITSITSASIQLYLAMKINKIILLAAHHTKYLIATVIMVLVILVCNEISQKLFITIFLAAITYFLSLFALKDYFIMNVLAKIKQKY